VQTKRSLGGLLEELEDDLSMGSDLENVMDDLKPKVQATVELNMIRNQSV